MKQSGERGQGGNTGRDRAQRKGEGKQDTEINTICHQRDGGGEQGSAELRD